MKLAEPDKIIFEISINKKHFTVYFRKDFGIIIATGNIENFCSIDFSFKEIYSYFGVDLKVVKDNKKS